MLQLRLKYWTDFEELRSDTVEKKNFPSWLQLWDKVNSFYSCCVIMDKLSAQDVCCIRRTNEQAHERMHEWTNKSKHEQVHERMHEWTIEHTYE